MKAVVVNQYGGADKLEVADIPVPSPAADEVLVKIAAAGVNPVDGYFREGFLGDDTFPLVMGSDFAGTVESIGSEVKDFQVGDKVYGYKYLGNGTYAGYATVKADLVAHMPKNLSFEEAAAIPCAGLIALETVAHVLSVSGDDTFLVTGGAGGVGSFAIQVAKARAATVIAVVGTDNVEYVKNLGADTVIDYTKDDYATAVRNIYPDGVTTALATAPQTVSTITAAVADNGHITWITDPNNGPVAERGIKVTYTNGSRGRALLDEFTALVEAGKVTVPIAKVYSLGQAVRAQTEAASGHVQGKLVIRTAA